MEEVDQYQVLRKAVIHATDVLARLANPEWYPEETPPTREQIVASYDGLLDVLYPDDMVVQFAGKEANHG